MKKYYHYTSSLENIINILKNGLKPSNGILNDDQKRDASIIKRRVFEPILTDNHLFAGTNDSVIIEQRVNECWNHYSGRCNQGDSNKDEQEWATDFEQFVSLYHSDWMINESVKMDLQRYFYRKFSEINGKEVIYYDLSHADFKSGQKTFLIDVNKICFSKDKKIHKKYGQYGRYGLEIKSSFFALRTDCGDIQYFDSNNATLKTLIELKLQGEISHLLRNKIFPYIRDSYYSGEKEFRLLTNTPILLPLGDINSVYVKKGEEDLLRSALGKEYSSLNITSL